PKGSYKHDAQLRPLSGSARTSGRTERSTGLSNKLSKGGDLLAFTVMVEDHLVKTGMDTIAYLPDPQDPTNMLYLTTHHMRFTTDSAFAAWNSFGNKRDGYDERNNTSANDFLLNSLDAELQKTITSKLPANRRNIFVVTWTMLMSEVLHSALNRVSTIEKRIESRRPAKYPGQNIALLADDFIADAQALVPSGQYNHKMTLAMCNAFLMAGGPGSQGELYRSDLIVFQKKLSRFLVTAATKPKHQVEQEIEQENLTFWEVCSLAREAYKAQVETNDWYAARHTRDSKAIHSSFQAAANIASTDTEGNPLIDPAQLAAAYALLQNRKPAGKPKPNGNRNNRSPRNNNNNNNNNRVNNKKNG
ncbi:MAG: hypothetical protein ACX936_21555, partial [Marinobacter sp.]